MVFVSVTLLGYVNICVCGLPKLAGNIFPEFQNMFVSRFMIEQTTQNHCNMTRTGELYNNKAKPKRLNIYFGCGSRPKLAFSWAATALLKLKSMSQLPCQEIIAAPFAFAALRADGKALRDKEKTT